MRCIVPKPHHVAFAFPAGKVHHSHQVGEALREVWVLARALLRFPWPERGRRAPRLACWWARGSTGRRRRLRAAWAAGCHGQPLMSGAMLRFQAEVRLCHQEELVLRHALIRHGPEADILCKSNKSVGERLHSSINHKVHNFLVGERLHRSCLWILWDRRFHLFVYSQSRHQWKTASSLWHGGARVALLPQNCCAGSRCQIAARYGISSSMLAASWLSTNTWTDLPVYAQRQAPELHGLPHVGISQESDET